MPGEESQAGTGEPTGTAVAAEVATGQVVKMYGDQTAQPEAPRPAVPAKALLIVIGIAALAALALFGVARSRSSAGPAVFQDLGAGISNVAGLRGHLQARWQGKSAQYQLKIEPLDPLQSAGFSYVAAHPPQPLLLHMKLLDATGFAVCGKDVLFPYDPASPGENDRERGQDVLQPALGDDGSVVSLSAQGTLPCTADQYKQVVYWDFSTDFPALAEQDELMKRSAGAKTRMAERERAALRRQRTPRSAFYMEGDDRVIGYDAAHSVLETRLNRSFRVSGTAQQSLAGQWAAGTVLFHYKCDQHSHCILTSAGGGQSLSVAALQ